MLDPRANNSPADPGMLLAQSPYAALIVDDAGLILASNAAAHSLFGAGADTLQSRPIDQLLSRQDDGAVSRTTRPETLREAKGRHENGTSFPAEVAIAPIDDGRRSFIIRDITPELEREYRYRAMVETSKYAQFVMIGEKFVFANQAAVETFGFDSIEAFTDIHPSQISPEYQPNGKTSFEMANEMVALAYENGWVRFDWTHLHTNGELIPMEITLTRMPHMGEDALFAGCADMRDRVRTEEMVRRSQKMDAIGQLTGGIAHDFNNILGIIKGNLELLQRALPENTFAQDRLTAALAGATRGADITRKLLAFSHKKSHETKRVDVNHPIREFENLIGKSLTAAVKLELDLGEDLWPVDIDPADFENVILNLALNARDAMPNGGRLLIETRNRILDETDIEADPAVRGGEFVCVSVSDTGTGMSSEIVEKVFDPFFTTKEEGKGTGLGLSMVYGFVKQSNGQIKIWSNPGAGTTFLIFLPRASEGDGEDISAFSIEDALPRGSATILLVDDEVALLEVTTAQLEDLGYRVIARPNGQAALDTLTTRSDIDLLLSDVVMPGGMDGFDLASRAARLHPELRIQMTSGFTKQLEGELPDPDSQQAKLSRTLLRKPYNQRELAHAIKDCLDKREI
jgi:PAS domain S-box-containing protein